jgi:general secretion pathway protein H
MISDGKGRPRISSDLGFTVFEVLLVVALISLATAISIPLVRASTAGLKLRQSTYDLVTQLRTARSTAQRNNIEQVIQFDSLRYQYSIGIGQSTRRILPSDIHLVVAVPDIQRLGPFLSQIRFYPDGSSSGGNIVLRDGRRHAAVHVDWLSGDVRVRWN